MADTSGKYAGAVPGSIGEMFERAISSHEARRLPEAEALYKDVLSADPDHAGALCYLGRLYLENGNLQEGLSLLRRSVAEDPNSPEAQDHLGTALHLYGDFAAALERHDLALSLAPDYHEALYGRGCALQSLGHGSEAIKCYEDLVARVADNARYQYGLAVLLKAAGRNEEAFVHFRNAANLDQGFAVHLSKALADYDHDHQEKARLARQRLNRYVGLFLTNQGNARMGTYPDLTAAPFHSADTLPGVLALENNYPAIRREIEQLAATDFQSESEGLRERGNWDVFLFYERGRRNENNCARCPTIARIIDSNNTVRTQAGLLYVSKLDPGTRIKPHRGPTNMRLRCHLGVSVPDGDCGLKVGGEVRRWQEGRCVVFDDSLEHEAWNFTQAPRVVLIIDFWHPDMTPTEISYLEGLHRFAAFQAISLNRYWSANANERTKARAGYD
jgi:aspartate beta-hydroxylase